uniref:Uncharacterized protein n=1 Tax=Utricularia reniformis TaxID=192314 RepID=A0A1Y0B4S9_9LAMI|nr:hypothetical protein AEK19_MT2286 [Utricularia reniformis]ART32431.1 hypothetical protein AEK19_MT2286 [Utricularia reniformis]
MYIASLYCTTKNDETILETGSNTSLSPCLIHRCCQYLTIRFCTIYVINACMYSQIIREKNKNKKTLMSDCSLKKELGS